MHSRGNRPSLLLCSVFMRATLQVVGERGGFSLSDGVLKFAKSRQGQHQEGKGFTTKGVPQRERYLGISTLVENDSNLSQNCQTLLILIL